MLSSVGIETSVETMPASVFFKRFARGGPDKTPEFTAAMSGYANGSENPSPSIFIHTKQKRGMALVTEMATAMLMLTK